MPTAVLARVREVSKYADGTPSLEIHVPRDRAGGLPFLLGSGVPIVLRIAGTEYEAILRATEGNDYVWVSPTLRTIRGVRTTLGHVLTRERVHKNAEVTLIVDGHVIAVENGATEEGEPMPATTGPPIVRELDAPASRVQSIRRDSIRPPMATESATRDPLVNVDWSALYRTYDAKCIGFNSASAHLLALTPAPVSDRALYYRLLDVIRHSDANGWAIDVGTYDALLYWKLYSQPAAVANVATWLAPYNALQVHDRLSRLLASLPSSLTRDWQQIRRLLSLMDLPRVPGMAGSEALPVRTTFLHFLYPSVVPIFDKMVLRATNMWSLGANGRLAVLEEYLPVAWGLADAYEARLRNFSETPLRLVDMALCVARGSAE